jgi:hypothetical protein
MDLIQHARALYATGRMHDALEAAQAACDRAPKDAGAWLLLGTISRHTGMPAASDEAFRRAAVLDSRYAPPHRVTADRFRALVDEITGALDDEPRQLLASTTIRAQPVPTPDQVRAGVDPDALTHRERVPHEVLVLFQVNHENRCHSEVDLRELVLRSLTLL